MLQKESDLPRAVILTAIPVEYQAVRTHLTNIHEEIHPRGTIYERGIFSSTGQSWDVVIGEIGAGNPAAAFEAERAINYFMPTVMVFVGVAGGRKDVKLGDVVVATKIYQYESGKAETIFLPRPNISNSSYRMEQRARAEARKHDWLQHIKQPLSSFTPTVHVAPIAAGEKVVASTRSAIAEFLRTNYDDALAVEMEGYGFLQAVHANAQVEALVIRGVSDLLDGKHTADAANFLQLAAQHASAFAFQVLARLSTNVYNTLPGQPGSALQHQYNLSRTQIYPYDVALSFAKEDTPYADALAANLKRAGVRIFYESDEHANLLGKNLVDFLFELYSHGIQYCVMLLSQHYATNRWSILQRRAAQARAFEELSEFILPVRLDRTEISGVLSTMYCLNWPPENAESIAAIIVKKLNLNQQ